MVLGTEAGRAFERAAEIQTKNLSEPGMPAIIELSATC